METLCRDCCRLIPAPGRCPHCGSPRLLSHPELTRLSIAHIDCDAFYASVEKRDDPALRDRPLIVGGGQRGVVTTACYIARIKGVRSAMPMFQALKLCPEAAVVRPRMDAYVAVSRQIRALMEDLTPLVEPLSLDEAFLDLSGTDRLHHAPPAVLMARLVRRIETEIGVTASVGLSHNKFLAKIASDLEKPRGFSVLGVAEAPEFLARQKVGMIWGVGASTRETLAQDGIRTIADLLRRDRRDLIARYGQMGERLYRLARGEDTRPVSPGSAAKSVSNETTFSHDITDPDLLDGHLWRLADKVSARLKAQDLAGRVVTLKLKRADHRLLTRRVALPEPTQLAGVIHASAGPLLARALPEAPFRLLGIGLSELGSGAQADLSADLLDPEARRRHAAERAADRIRARFGTDAIVKGRALR
ncbi:DNA polymerase IV [Halovulum dunhuangense]|uniref:DNA polymerase IV n=1 Tax=Halovulum dunhuangense TaxID=1505036 RepID=A0A849KTI7_9RHOB|nr:DNA polymerase IV [Halovulum dunhuangense]NNU78811.1 DNA polymerase IV [Halovulum dunhuangense]